MVKPIVGNFRVFGCFYFELCANQAKPVTEIGGQPANELAEIAANIAKDIDAAVDASWPPALRQRILEQRWTLDISFMLGTAGFALDLHLRLTFNCHVRPGLRFS